MLKSAKRLSVVWTFEVLLAFNWIIAAHGPFEQYIRSSLSVVRFTLILVFTLDSFADSRFHSRSYSIFILTRNSCLELVLDFRTSSCWSFVIELLEVELCHHDRFLLWVLYYVLLNIASQEAWEIEIYSCPRCISKTVIPNGKVVKIPLS